MNLSLKNITIKFGQYTILDNVSLSINSGEFMALLGCSGSGKTTLLNALCGLIKLNNGTITDGPLAIHDLPVDKREIGVVFQQPRLFPHLNVAENIAFSLKMKGVSKNKQRTRVKILLDEMGLAGFENREIKSLSSGQKQRVAIARAIAIVPKLLILDEAFANLDDNIKNNMHALITNLHKKEHLTIMLITHDIGEALTLSDRVLHLKNGKIAFDNSPQNLIEQKENHPIINNWVNKINKYTTLSKLYK